MFTQICRTILFSNIFTKITLTLVQINLSSTAQKLTKCQIASNNFGIKFYNALPVEIHKLASQKFISVLKKFFTANAFYSFNKFFRNLLMLALLWVDRSYSRLVVSNKLSYNFSIMLISWSALRLFLFHYFLNYFYLMKNIINFNFFNTGFLVTVCQTLHLADYLRFINVVV